MVEIFAKIVGFGLFGLICVATVVLLHKIEKWMVRKEVDGE